MPLSVKDGMGAWISDFKKSDAPQFKGKSEKERRDMAIAAYMDAKRGGKNEATDNPPFEPDKKKTSSTVKDKSGAVHTPMSRARHLARMARDRNIKNEEVEENYNWKVSHAGRDVHVKAPHAGAAVKKAQKGFGNTDLTKAKISNLGKVGTPARESVELDEMFASTVDKHKDGYRPKVVKDGSKMHYLGSQVYKSKEHARNAADHIANAYRKGRASDSYIQDFARRHHKEHGMKESTQIDELDSKTYRSYVNKAEADQIKRMSKGKHDDKSRHTMQKRAVGIGIANMKKYGDKRTMSQRIRQGLNKESVEHIEEAANPYANAGRALADYARKQGGMDKADFNKASKFMYQIGKADILSKGQHLAAFSKFFRGLDTDVRDGIVQILKKQNVMESIEQLDELSPATHKSYQAKAFSSGAAGMAAKRMGTMSAKDAYDNEKKRHAGIERSKFLQRRDARKNRNEETELDEADNFEKNFRKRISATVRGDYGDDE